MARTLKISVALALAMVVTGIVGGNLTFPAAKEAGELYRQALDRRSEMLLGDLNREVDPGTLSEEYALATIEVDRTRDKRKDASKLQFRWQAVSTGGIILLLVCCAVLFIRGYAELIVSRRKMA